MKYVWQGGWKETIRRIGPRLFPAIHSDRMDPLVNHANGQIYDSKSQFRAATRAAGCVELGNDAPLVTEVPRTDRKQLRSDINRAISELEAGRSAPIGANSEGLVRRYDG